MLVLVSQAFQSKASSFHSRIEIPPLARQAFCLHRIASAANVGTALDTTDYPHFASENNVSLRGRVGAGLHDSVRNQEGEREKQSAQFSSAL